MLAKQHQATALKDELLPDPFPGSFQAKAVTVISTGGE